MRNKLFCQNDYFDGVSVHRAETIFHQHEDRPLVGWVVDHQSAETEDNLKTNFKLETEKGKEAMLKTTLKRHL